MANMSVSQLISSIAYLKCYLEESLSQGNALRELNEQKDATIMELEARIKTLEDTIETRDNEINEMKGYLDSGSNETDSEHKFSPKNGVSNDNIKECQNEMILILKERCDDLTGQLLATRTAWHEKCILIEKYRRELTDVGDQITGVHKKLNEMKAWQQNMETFYMSLKENQEHNQVIAIEENSRINSEISDLKRLHNERFIQMDEIKNIATMNETGDGLCKDEKQFKGQQLIIERKDIVNRMEIFSNMVSLDQFDVVHSSAADVDKPIMIGISFFKNFDIFNTIKSKFGKAMKHLSGNDKKKDKDALVSYGLPATIIFCFVTGTLLSQMVFKNSNGQGFTVSQVAGPKNLALLPRFGPK